MCAHEMNEIGLPLDPELRRLEEHLCALAGAWRASWGDASRQEEIVREYHTTMTKLYALGWDGILDIECELLRDLMPKAYLQRHSIPDEKWQWKKT